MGGWALLPAAPGLLSALLIFFCIQDFFCKFATVHSFELLNKMDSVLGEGKDNTLLPSISPNSSPQPFVPLLAPSPMATPFLTNSTPKLSGRCSLNFSAIDSLIRTTAVDCWTSFAPFLANVICCPQFQATLTILVGHSSRDTGMLALDSTHANHCLSDVEQILGSRGANIDLQEICAVDSSNLTEGSCPINDMNGFESIVDPSELLAACGKVDSVNECCSQICQNAISEAARDIAFFDGDLRTSKDTSNHSFQHISKIDSCRSIVLRWLSGRLEPSSANDVLRRLSNCKVNGVCPLTFPDTSKISKDCGAKTKNHSACCNAMNNYVSHLQKQSFITNLQALDCASLLAMNLQKMNVSTDVYSLCQITLKDFSLQVGSQESGCLLPSLPSDATFDPFSGISFTCDLNDNIAAPWPSASRAPSSSCNKSVNFPALPAATSAQVGQGGVYFKIPVVISLLSMIVMMF